MHRYCIYLVYLQYIPIRNKDFHCAQLYDFGKTVVRAVDREHGLVSYQPAIDRE